MSDLPKYNFIGYEEEDKYHLFDEFAEHAEESRKWLIHHLYYELGYFSLHEYFHGYINKYPFGEFNYRNLYSESYKDSFFDYLLNLLMLDHLKVTVSDRILTKPTENELQNYENMIGVFSSKNVKVYDKVGEMKNAVADIKERWSKLPNYPELKEGVALSREDMEKVQIIRNFEDYGVTFFLKKEEG